MRPLFVVALFAYSLVMAAAVSRAFGPRPWSAVLIGWSATLAIGGVVLWSFDGLGWLR